MLPPPPFFLLPAAAAAGVATTPLRMAVGGAALGGVATALGGGALFASAKATEKMFEVTAHRIDQSALVRRPTPHFIVTAGFTAFFTALNLVAVIYFVLFAPWWHLEALAYAMIYVSPAIFLNGVLIATLFPMTLSPHIVNQILIQVAGFVAFAVNVLGLMVTFQFVSPSCAAGIWDLATNRLVCSQSHGIGIAWWVIGVLNAAFLLIMGFVFVGFFVYYFYSIGFKPKMKPSFTVVKPKAQPEPVYETQMAAPTGYEGYAQPMLAPMYPAPYASQYAPTLPQRPSDSLKTQ